MTARTIMLASLILCCFALSGCWDYKELEQQALLTGLGYDVGGKGDFLVIAYLDEQQSSSGDKAPQSQKAQTQVVVVKSKHALESYHLLSLQIPQFKYVSHLYTMVFSEAFAKSSSFSEIVDRITRVGSVRRRISLLITPDHVKDIFSQRLPGADSTARGLPDLVLQGNLLQLVPRIDLNEFVYQSTLPGVDAVLPEIHVVESNGHPVLKAAGAAVFHRMKMVGYLAPEDVRALLWLMGKSGHSFLALPGFQKNDAAFFRTEEVKTSIKTSVRGGRPFADVKVELTGTLAAYRGEHLLRKADIKQLESMASRVFRKKLIRVLKKTQAMKADPAGFGVLVRAQVGSAVWRKRYVHWSEEEYPRMTVHIQVKAHISSAEATTDPISVQQTESGSPQS